MWGRVSLPKYWWARAGGQISIPCNGRNWFCCVQTAQDVSEMRAICWQMPQCSHCALSQQTVRIDDRQMNAHVRFTLRHQRAAVTHAQTRCAVGLHAVSLPLICRSFVLSTWVLFETPLDVVEPACFSLPAIPTKAVLQRWLESLKLDSFQLL
jgi:hypothetical protein